MPDKAELFEMHAEECRRRAQAASTTGLQATFLELADGWMELAALRRQLDNGRAQAVENFPSGWIDLESKGREIDPDGAVPRSRRLKHVGVAVFIHE
jgi:hypothetical protein